MLALNFERPAAWQRREVAHARYQPAVCQARKVTVDRPTVQCRLPAEKEPYIFEGLLNGELQKAAWSLTAKDPVFCLPDNPIESMVYGSHTLDIGAANCAAMHEALSQGVDVSNLQLACLLAKYSIVENHGGKSKYKYEDAGYIKATMEHGRAGVYVHFIHFEGYYIPVYHGKTIRNPEGRLNGFPNEKAEWLEQLVADNKLTLSSGIECLTLFVPLDLMLYLLVCSEAPGLAYHQKLVATARLRNTHARVFCRFRRPQTYRFYRLC